MSVQPFLVVVDSSAKVREEWTQIIDKIIKPIERNLCQEQVKLQYILLVCKDYSKRCNGVVEKVLETDDIKKLSAALEESNFDGSFSSLIYTAFAEGLARALEIIEDTKASDSNVSSPNILLVSNTAPLDVAAQFSNDLKYDGKTFDQLLTTVKSNSINFSFISLRRNLTNTLQSYNNVFGIPGANGINVETETELELPNYLIRLCNFGLSSKAKSRKEQQIDSSIVLADAEVKKRTEGLVANDINKGHPGNFAQNFQPNSMVQQQQQQQLKVQNFQPNSMVQQQQQVKPPQKPVMFKGIDMRDLTALRAAPFFEKLSNMQKLEIVYKHAEITNNMELMTKTRAYMIDFQKKQQPTPSMPPVKSHVINVPKSSSMRNSPNPIQIQTVNMSPQSISQMPQNMDIRLQQQEQILRQQQQKQQQLNASGSNNVNTQPQMMGGNMIDNAIAWTGTINIILTINGQSLRQSLHLCASLATNSKLGRPTRVSEYQFDRWPIPVEMGGTVPVNSDVMSRSIPIAMFLTLSPTPGIPNNSEYYNIFSSQLASEKKAAIARLHENWVFLIMSHSSRLMGFVVNPSMGTPNSTSTATHLSSSSSHQQSASIGPSSFMQQQQLQQQQLQQQQLQQQQQQQQNLMNPNQAGRNLTHQQQHQLYHMLQQQQDRHQHNMNNKKTPPVMLHQSPAMNIYPFSQLKLMIQMGRKERLATIG